MEYLFPHKDELSSLKISFLNAVVTLQSGSSPPRQRRVFRKKISGSRL